MNNFSELSVSPVLQKNLLRHGFINPTPVQAQAIEPALAGRDVVATAQTGTGQTPRAIVLSPTRELAIQIHEVFAKMAHGTGLRAAVVVGGLSEKTQLDAIRKGAQVLIATPGRLVDFLDRNLVRLSGVRTLVLDEADRMLDMGFLPVIRRIMSSVPADRQTLFFSATIETSVKHLVEVHVKNPVRIEVGSITKPAEEVDLHYYQVEQDLKLDLLRSMLANETGSFLVFARTKHGADRVARRLAQEGVKCAAIHGDRSQNQRNQALKGFQDGYYRALIATDVAARGIHVEGIAHVVNFDLPQVPEDFIHRVGRTGRAGARGTATTFARRDERSDLQRIERTLGVRLERRELPAGLHREERSSAPVIVLPAGTARVQTRTRSFAPRRCWGR